MQSWPAYESYTGPLGLQTLTDITGSHYGPNIESSENNGWGQWHRADHDGVGMDRTVATGTGYVGQYSPEVAKINESAATTPDDLLLFFHHLPYTWKLHDGKTVIQYLYDSTLTAPGKPHNSSRTGHLCKAASILNSTPTCSRAFSTRPTTPSSGATPSLNTSSSSAESPTTMAAPAIIPTASKPKKPSHRLQSHRCKSMGRRQSRQSRLLRRHFMHCRVDLPRHRWPLQRCRPIL